MLKFLAGGLCSAAILGLFHNLQAISDAAPSSIKNGSLPGLLGALVAIPTVIWLAMIPYWFVRTVTRKSTGQTNQLAMFPVGAFVVIAGYFVIFHTDKVKAALP